MAAEPKPQAKPPRRRVVETHLGSRLLASLGSFLIPYFGT